MRWCALAAALLLALDGGVSGAQAPASAGPASAALIEDLVAGNRVLAQEGIVDAFGHISARHDRDPGRFLLSRSLAPALVTAGDLIEYDLDSVPVNAGGRPQYSERFIHGAIYKLRPDVHAIVHAHSPSVVPFSVSSRPLRAVYHMGGFIGAGLPLFDIRSAAGITDMLIRDPARGQALGKALGTRPGVLMRGHGFTVVGGTIPHAVGRGIYLEANARIQLHAESMGGDVTYLDPGEAAEILKAEPRAYARPWELWKRQAMGR